MKIKFGTDLGKACLLAIALLVLARSDFAVGASPGSTAHAAFSAKARFSAQAPASSASSGVVTAPDDDDDNIAQILAAYQQSVSAGHVVVDMANLSVIYDASQDTGSSCTPYLDMPAYVLSSGFVSSTNDFVLQFATQSTTGSNYWVRGRIDGNGKVTQQFKVNCNSILDSPHDSVSAHYAGSQWVNGLFQESGMTYTLIHNEYYGGNFPTGLNFSIPATDQCNLGGSNSTPANPISVNPLGCTYAAIGIASMQSAGGVAFSPENGRPGYLVARSSFNYVPNGGGIDPRDGHWDTITGYPTNTNIVKRSDGYYYFMAGEQYPNGSPGSYGGKVSSTFYCPVRTNDLTNPSSWRAWDGSGYTVTTNVGGDCPGVTELPPFPFYLGYNTYFRRYIIVGATSASPQNQSNPAFAYGEAAYALSSDLVHWTPPVRLGIPMWAPQVSGVWGSNNYISLIDPVALEAVQDANSSSGAITGKDPYLVFIQHNDNYATRVVEVPIHFSN